MLHSSSSGLRENPLGSNGKQMDWLFVQLLLACAQNSGNNVTGPCVTFKGELIKAACLLLKVKVKCVTML